MITEGDYVRFNWGCDLWRIFNHLDYEAQVEYVVDAKDGTRLYALVVRDRKSGGTMRGSAYERWISKVSAE